MKINSKNYKNYLIFIINEYTLRYILILLFSSLFLVYSSPLPVFITSFVNKSLKWIIFHYFT
jgi:hypothetical protein